VDAIVSPSTPAVAAPIDTLLARVNGKEQLGLWLHRPFLTPHNLTGAPAIAVPMGFSTDGLPLSLQIVGRPWGEADLLGIAHAYESATPQLRARRPPGP
jgi:aspartyl-tRNA(Asn)/glutamyl-tRNA(Gln) amidotransferase subunit A